MTAIKRRAVSSEQKEKRRQDILDSAKELFEATSDYNSLLMKHIAENIGLTKGTLYLYFKTKEEVFLALYTDEFNRCFALLDQALDQVIDHGTVERVAESLGTVLAKEDTFLRLTAMLHSVLEQNIEFETALAFKTLLRDRLIHAGAKLEACFPVLSEGKGVELLLATHALMIGYYHAALPTPCLEEILERPDMSFMRMDFETEFKKALGMMIFAFVEKEKSGS